MADRKLEGGLNGGESPAVEHECVLRERVDCRCEARVVGEDAALRDALWNLDQARACMRVAREYLTRPALRAYPHEVRVYMEAAAAHFRASLESEKRAVRS